jgi:hypothetical protein
MPQRSHHCNVPIIPPPGTFHHLTVCSNRDKRASGTLKAWTSSGSGCSGNPGFTWTSIGDGCIHFIGGDGSAKLVQRLSWSGQACQVYGYSATGCNTNQQSTAYGTDLCFKGVTFLSFKVVC